MAAVPVSLNVPKRITLDAVADTAQEIELPDNARGFVIQFLTSADVGVLGKWAASGTDGAAIGSDYWTVPAGAAMSFEYDRRGVGRSLFVASTTGSAIVEIVAVLS